MTSWKVTQIIEEVHYVFDTEEAAVEQARTVWPDERKELSIFTTANYERHE